MWIRAWLVILILCLSRNLRYATKYVKVVLRLLLPLCLYIYDAWLRNQKTVVSGLRKQLGPAVHAVLSLSSLSGQLTVMWTSMGVHQSVRWVCGWLKFEHRQGAGYLLTTTSLPPLWVQLVNAGGYFPWQTTMGSVEALQIGFLYVFIGKFYWY